MKLTILLILILSGQLAFSANILAWKDKEGSYDLASSSHNNTDTCYPYIFFKIFGSTQVQITTPGSIDANGMPYGSLLYLFSYINEGAHPKERFEDLYTRREMITSTFARNRLYQSSVGQLTKINGGVNYTYKINVENLVSFDKNSNLVIVHKRLNPPMNDDKSGQVQVFKSCTYHRRTKF